MALTALNTVGLLALVARRIAELRRDATGQDLQAFYATLSPSELSMRFARPEHYDGLDDFARPNALQEILSRGLLTRGMHVEAVRRVLAHPDSSITAQGLPGITLGQTFD